MSIEPAREVVAGRAGGSGPARGASLTAGAVDVWRVELDGVPADAASLSDEERRRAARMKDERRQGRFLASRVALREVLGGCLGVDGGAVRFILGAAGKPAVVDGGDLSFSLSRSGGVALVAVTRGREVGVDVERVVPDGGLRRVAEHFFSPAEAAALRALAEPDRLHAFYRLWVRKEAVAKASGAGLGEGITHVEVAGDVVGRWSVASLDAGAGFVAAVAVDGPLGPLSTRDWAPATG